MLAVLYSHQAWPWRSAPGYAPPAMYDLARTAATVTGILGAAVAVAVTLRRQRSTEETVRLTAETQKVAAAAQQTTANAYRLDVQRMDQERILRLRDRYTTIAAQLGHEADQVRLAGVHAMAALADDWLTQGSPDHHEAQTCIDVLCAYLRTPRDTKTAAAERGDLEVRQTITRVITAHLLADAKSSWSTKAFDLTGANLSGRHSFAKAQFAKESHVSFERALFEEDSRVTFTGATFNGVAGFAGARFRGYVRFDGARFDGSVSFHDAVFEKGGDAKFDYAEFDSLVKFDRVSFNGASRVSFLQVRCNDGCDVDFSEAQFKHDSQVRFANVNFNEGSQVGFDAVALEQGSEVAFSGMTVNGSVTFDGARFGAETLIDAVLDPGGRVSFKGAHFDSGSDIRALMTLGRDSEVTFACANFNDGSEVSFGLMTFSEGSRGRFEAARFNEGSQVVFGGACFKKGSTVGFEHARFSEGSRVSFLRPQFKAGSRVSFAEARFNQGSRVSFQEPEIDEDSQVGFAGAEFTVVPSGLWPLGSRPGSWPPVSETGEDR